jgi:chromosome segregation ATPase
MKTNAIITFLVAGALSFTACTNKVDEKTVADINQFGTDWTALGETTTNWSNELTQTTTQAKEFAQKQNEMMASMATSKDQAMKAKMNEMSAKATQDATNLETMQTEWNSFKTTWDETTKNFSDWKEKVMKGEIKPEQAQKDLADFKTKMTDVQTRIEGWKTSYASLKTSCEQNMAMAGNMTTPAEAPKK